MSKGNILCKYIAPAGIDVLQNLRLLVQNPNNFNDPFEFLLGIGDVSKDDYIEAVKGGYGKSLYSRRPKEFRKLSLEDFINQIIATSDAAIKNLPENLQKEGIEFKKHYGNNVCGVICFSSANVDVSKEILLWSHYASSHEGMRIFFNVEKMNIKSTSLSNINYTDTRLLFDPVLFLKDLDGHSEAVLKNMLTTKSNLWEYENEVRWLISYAECLDEHDQNGDVARYIEFGPEAIVGVDFGAKMTPKFKEAMKSILKLDYFKHVKIRESVLCRKSYELIYVDVNN